VFTKLLLLFLTGIRFQIKCPLTI